MEGRQHQVLHVRAEIDQQIAAGDQVDAGKRRILQDAVVREKHGVTQLLAYPVVIPFMNKETA